MFKNTFQSGFLSILYSIGARRQAAAPAQRGGHATANGNCLPARATLAAGCRSARTRACALFSPRASQCTRARSGSKPLQIWKEEVNNGHCKRITDNDIQSSVLEIMSTNISTTFVTCPNFSDRTLGIKLPFLVMIIKNVRRAPQRLARRRTQAP